MTVLIETRRSILRSCAVALVLVAAAISPQYAASGELIPYPDSASPPDFDLPDLGGQRHRLDEYRGQVVLVNFWATWCPPCLAEMPSMQRLSVAMRERPFQILAINVDEAKATVWKFTKLLNIAFTTLLDSKGEVAMAWNVEIFPSSYVIDSEGRVRYVAYGALQWENAEVINVIEALMPDRGSETIIAASDTP